MFQNNSEEQDESSKNEKEERVTIAYKVKQYKSWTVHLGVARYDDGDSEKFMFDKMNRSKTCIVLKDYTKFSPKGNKSRAFITIPYHNLKNFETIQRRKVNCHVGERRHTKTGVKLPNAKKKVDRMRRKDKYTDVSINGVDY